MKLIDLLVKELPKRGGWPDGAVCATQDKDGEVCFSEGETPEFGLVAWHDGGWRGNKFHTITATDYDTAIITRAQYESALAASQKQTWNGEGVPPVGCECEFISNDTSWGVVRVIGMDDDKVVIKPSGEVYYGITPSNRQVFRPLRTESERKRDAFINAVLDDMRTIPYDLSLRDEVAVIYDSIAAGKIPGVKLDD